MMLKNSKQRRFRLERLRSSDIFRNLRSNVGSVKRWNIECGIIAQHWRVTAFGIFMLLFYGSISNLVHANHNRMEDFLSNGGENIFSNFESIIHSANESLFCLNALVFCVVTCGAAFTYKRPRCYSAVPLTRALFVMGCCLSIQCISCIFSFPSEPVTDCQSGSQKWYEMQLNPGVESQDNECRYRVLGPHLTFTLVVMITVYLYASHLVPKIAYVVWMEMTISSCILLSVVIMTSKKSHHHYYGVDVFTTWYTVPLVYYASFWVYKDSNGDQLSKDQGQAQSRRSGLRLHLDATESVQFPFDLVD